ncbi:MAG: hypothetical protein HQ502_06875 [Alphaproteobacteria bacterium]|nr:hypothetical protein [Alphaproteobacteria bacterium]
MNSQDHPRRGMRIASVNNLPEVIGYEWLSVPALRHLIFNSQERLNSKGDVIPGNGLNKAIVRIGRKVLIDIDAFDAWLETHRCREDA